MPGEFGDGGHPLLDRYSVGRVAVADHELLGAVGVPGFQILPQVRVQIVMK